MVGSYYCNLLLLSSFVVVVVIQQQHSVVSATVVTTKETITSCFDGSLSLEENPDSVKYIPGYDQPLPSKWYSGYLTYEFHNRTIHTHYTFVEAEDNEDGNKPIIYWSNGGPGASSLFGLLTELGPLLFNDLSLQTDEYRTTGIPTPLYNKYTWTRLGHILVFDQPAPIGFSYCNNLTDSHSCDGIAWTDELTSQNALAALQTFYNKYSCLQSLDLYLTGESYAGIYIPTFAREIINYNNKMKDDAPSKIQLKGFAVGDGCLGTETDICISLSPSNPDGFDGWNLIFLAGHGQIPLTTLREVFQACRPDDNNNSIEEIMGSFLLRNNQKQPNNDNNNKNYKESESSAECKNALQKVKNQVGGVYDYGLYDECTYENGLSYKTKKSSSLSFLSNNNNYDNFVNGAVNDYPCGGDIVMEHMYLSLPIVQAAFHLQSTWFSVDNAGLDFDYTPAEKDLTSFYKKIVTNNKEQKNDNIRVLIYNGDTDPAITSFAAQNWTSHLGFDVKEEWRPWTVDSCRRVGGYVTRYGGDFDFLTIRGAGHMVPTNKAAAAFTFIKSWIQGDNYPIYDKDCEAPHSKENPVSHMATEIKNT